MSLFDTVLVVDIEATCDEPQPSQQEIIEVGVVLLNTTTLQIEREESILVEPYGEITPFCTKLTTLTIEQIREAEAPRFREACTRLEAGFLSKERPWASWGDFDRRAFQKQCREEDVPYPFSDTHTNLRVLFAQMLGLGQRTGMREALTMLDLPFEGTQHRGIDDARNIAKIFRELMKRGRAR